MANRFLERIMHGPADAGAMPLGGTRSEAVQRLQIGISGIVVMIMLVTLADTIRDRAEETDASAVPAASATTEPDATPTAQSDPLAEAGVVPDLPADPADAADTEQPVLPEQGENAPID